MDKYAPSYKNTPPAHYPVCPPTPHGVLCWCVEPTTEQAAAALPEPRQRRLLHFCTGCDRIPVGGLGALAPPLTITRAVTGGGGAERLPAAQTCFHVLLLPDYPDAATLAARLDAALDHAEGFGLT